MYMMSIAAGAKAIQLSAAYFVPDDNEVRMLAAAAKRGVKVQIIVPGKQTDSAAVRRASRSTWGGLLRAGVEIYEFQPTFFHCKVMVVDGVWVSVGSTNFDTRSFSSNARPNQCLRPALRRRATEIFEQDLKRSRRISLRNGKAAFSEKVGAHHGSSQLPA